MKLEEVNTRTKEAVDFLVASLDSGHSEVLTAYLGAMAKFHTYSFLRCAQHKKLNVTSRTMLIALQQHAVFGLSEAAVLHIAWEPSGMVNTSRLRTSGSQGNY